MSNLEQIISGKSVVVIDDDALMLQLVKTYCLDLGFNEVATFSRADKAWEVMVNRDDPFDFIISDWQMPGLSGVGFFNKIKTNKTYGNTPVLIISGFIDRSDFVLLEDYPLSSLLEKPFTKALLHNKIEQLVKEKFWYEKNETIIKDILSDFEDNPEKSTKKILESLKGSPEPVAFGIHLGKKLREMGLLQPAKSVLTWVVKQAPSSVMAMTECARVFKETGNLKEALEILDITNNISPENIERLCLTGEINLELNQPEQAKEVFDKVLDIDQENVVAKAGNKISDNLGEHLLTHDSYNLPNSFAGVLNLLAIEKVKSGSYDDGMEQYDSALVFVKDPTTIAKLKFNRGLGYLKWGKKDEALSEFKESAQLGGAAFARSKKYVEKMESVVSGTGVEDPFLGSPSSEKASPNMFDGDDSFEDTFDDDLEMGIFGTKSEGDLDVDDDVDLGAVLREDEGGTLVGEDLML
jgi:two-component system chemotaxis response regulator CheY